MNRYNQDNGSLCCISVDGTDFSIYELTPFSPCWYSNKLNAAVVCYKVGICIQISYIVWIYGPFPCSKWPNLWILREKLIYHLGEHEYVIADGGYNDGGNCTITPTGLNKISNHTKSTICAHHKTCNSRFKVWSVLKNTFCHNLDKHCACFVVVAIISQMAIENGGTPVLCVLFQNLKHSNCPNIY